jgi:hypothetical protein
MFELTPCVKKPNEMIICVVFRRVGSRHWEGCVNTILGPYLCSVFGLSMSRMIESSKMPYTVSEKTDPRNELIVLIRKDIQAIMSMKYVNNNHPSFSEVRC